MRIPSAFAPALIGLIVAVAPLAAQQAQRSSSQRPQRSGGIPGSELVVVATDTQCDTPEQVDAGLVNIRLFNRGTALHHVLVIQVDRLDRIPQIGEYLTSSSWGISWLHPMGGPDAVGPGGVSSASLVLDPGRYVLGCVASSPTKGRMQFKGGILRELAVVKSLEAGKPALPATELTMALNEWSFNLSGPVHAGRRTLRVRNDGRLEHHAWVVRLLPGKTLVQATKWVDDPSTPPPFEGMGGTRAIGAGASVNVTVDLVPGEYALLCTLFNPLSKKTHAAHGMVAGFTVVR